METKSFIIGALAGVAGFAVVDRFIHSASDPPSAGAETTAVAEADGTQVIDAPGPAVESATRAQRSTLAGPDARATPPESDFAARGSNSDRPIDAPQETPGVATPDARQDEETGWPAGFVGSDPRSAAARATEAKDVSWSYQMEQLLTHYLATHPSAAHFEIRSIDCRTTFCEIRATSPHTDAAPIWGHIAHDIGKQPWNDVGALGTSVAHTTTGFALIMRMTRPGTR